MSKKKTTKPKRKPKTKEEKIKDLFSNKKWCTKVLNEIKKIPKTDVKYLKFKIESKFINEHSFIYYHKYSHLNFSVYGFYIEDLKFFDEQIPSRVKSIPKEWRIVKKIIDKNVNESLTKK